MKVVSQLPSVIRDEIIADEQRSEILQELKRKDAAVARMRLERIMKQLKRA